MKTQVQSIFFYSCALVAAVLVIGTLFSSHAQALPTSDGGVAQEPIEKYMESPEVVGEARLRVVFWNVYDAVLYAPEGKFQSDAPFALSLTYLREFKGESIASRSIDEIREQGFSDEVKLATWYEQMKSVFPDVQEGENITGIRDQRGVCHFYNDGLLAGSIEDSEFTQWFFNIWFSEQTSEPKMRKQLLGMSE